MVEQHRPCTDMGVGFGGQVRVLSEPLQDGMCLRLPLLARRAPKNAVTCTDSTMVAAHVLNGDDFTLLTPCCMHFLQESTDFLRLEQPQRLAHALHRRFAHERLHCTSRHQRRLHPALVCLPASLGRSAHLTPAQAPRDAVVQRHEL